MTERRWLPVVVALVTAALVVTGCGSDGDRSLHDASGLAQKRLQIDIHPQDPVTLRDGGELRLAADQLPDNWNYYELDGPTGDGYRMISTVLPTTWAQNADGTVRTNENYLELAELTSQEPQVITYKLNPKARWSTGTSLSWEDFKAQAEALSGVKKNYNVATTAGYEDIDKVEKGATDQEVKVTFKRNFAEWQTLFSPLYPASLFADATEFNSGWLHAPKITAGPFKIDAIDLAAQSVTVVRDPSWWGTTPRLEKITFRVIPKAALTDSMASGAIDSYNIGSNFDLFRRAQETREVSIRQALATDYSTLVFNGAAGAILSDRDLRIALQRGIDTKAIATAVLGRLQSDPKPLGNHLFLQGAKEYEDNSDIVKFDRDAAREQLDDLGWRLAGDIRKRDGKELQIRFVIGAGNPLSQQVSQLVKSQLKEIGVRINIEEVPAADYFRFYVNIGNFDISTFRWLVTAFPVTNSRGVYYLDPANVNENYGKIGNSTINELFEQALSELDPDRRMVLTKQIDEEIWKSGSQLPLFQSSGAVAVRATVANFGAAGYATVPYDWIRVGFTR